MCGRFALFSSPPKIERVFSLPKIEDYRPRYNVAPSEEILAVAENPESKEQSASHLRWGLIPFWVDDPEDFQANLINARAETAAEKPSFREPFKKKRCVIPADGFYEWRAKNGDKQPYFLHPKAEDDLFGFAGLWDSWKDEENGKAIHSCTILTTDANPEIEDIHDRMPVILEKDEYDEWLDPDQQDPEKIQTLLDPYPGNKIDFHPVSKRVNNAGYDEEECIEPV